MKDLRTTLTGSVAALAVAVMPFLSAAESNLQELIGIIGGFSLFLKSLFTKDA